ncbi:MAG: sigma-70 family RNA polymerase sigma factor [Deltaproteobacteria bacterium]|nr:sigma-70 family RNA polymerase sigma factor [Deltaproteobacteria bacterium]
MNEHNVKSTRRPGDDGVLVRAFQAGNRAAFDRLVLKHKDKVFNLCYWFLGDYHEANDSAQDAFLRAYQSLMKFRSESTFSTWLYRIAVNTCKNRLKSSEYRRKKKMVWLDNPANSEGRGAAVEIEDESPSPLIELEKKERLALIKRAINTLPTEQKAVVVLRDIEGLSYDDVASITGVNLGTVKSRLARARLGLRKKLCSAHP